MASKVRPGRDYTNGKATYHVNNVVTENPYFAGGDAWVISHEDNRTTIPLAEVEQMQEVPAKPFPRFWEKK